MDLCTTSSVTQSFDCFDAQPARNPVIESFGNKLISHLKEGFVHHDKIADLDMIMCRSAHAKIDKEVADIGNPFTIFGFGYVNRFAAGVHHSFEITIICADKNAARKQIARIKTANRLDVDEPLTVDVTDQKANFIHVTQ